MRACLFQMMDLGFSSLTSITSGSSGFIYRETCKVYHRGQEKTEVCVFFDNWFPLSSFDLLRNALLLYLPCRGISGLRQNPLSPLSVLITCLIG